MCWFSLCSDILKHEELDGKIKAACLGSLLLPDKLNQLEEQYLSDKQVKTCTTLMLIKCVFLKYSEQ